MKNNYVKIIEDLTRVKKDINDLKEKGPKLDRIINQFEKIKSNNVKKMNMLKNKII